MLKFILEIKNRFFLLGVTCISISIVFYFYKEILLFLITQSNIFSNAIVTSSSAFYFIFTDVTEIFSVYIKLVFFFSSQVTFLFFVYHFFSFFAPATFKFEYYYSFKILRIALILWFFSVILVNYFLVPLMWNFFLNFPSFTPVYPISLYFEARLSEYLFFYMKLYYICIFYLQIFTILFFFLSYKKITKEYIKKFRKIYYYCFILLSTLLSPPDVLSQILVSFFIISLYEILLINILFKKYI